MILFLVLAAILSLAVGVALAVAVRRPRAGAVDRERVNVEIYRERCAELAAERAAGRLDEVQHAALLGELQRLLVDDVAPAAGEPGTAAGERGRGVGWSLVVLVPLLSVGVYVADGFGPDVRDWLSLSLRAGDAAALVDSRGEGALAASDVSLPDAARLTQSLLGRAPSDAQAWYRLGQTWIDLDAPALALGSLRTARRLAPDDLDIATRLADVELALAQGRLNDEVRAALDDVLSIDPAHQGVLMVYGMAAFNSGDYATAVTQWRRLQALLDPASEGAVLLGRSIGIAEARGAAAAAQATVPVRVEASALPADLPPTAALFVIVRAVQGPPMPVAVRKLPPVLPAEISLSDADQMVPGAPMATRGPLEVVARLSPDGSPMASAGALESPPVPLEFPVTGTLRLVLAPAAP